MFVPDCGCTCCTRASGSGLERCFISKTDQFFAWLSANGGLFWQAMRLHLVWRAAKLKWITHR